MNNDFQLSYNILKVNIRIVLLETPSNQHQSLHTLISCDFNIYHAIILMLLKVISK